MRGARERERRQLQREKEKAQQKGDRKEEAALCNQLGEVLARHGCFQEALEEHRQELRLVEGLEDVIGCAVAHRKIGECLAELESFEAALKHQHRHLELAQSLSNHTEQQRAWATIGRTHMFMAESGQSRTALREAEKAFMKSLAVLEEMPEGQVPPRELSEMRARLYLNLGLVYDGLTDPAKHSYYIKKSIYISEQTHLHEDLYRAYFNLGHIHQREGQPSQAMRYLERARECACKMKEKYLESECCAGIAQVLLSLGDFVAAKRSLKRAYALGSQQPQQRESILHSLRYATKASRLQQALEEAEADGNQQVALGLWEQLGDHFSKGADYQRSVEAYKKQLCLAESLKRPEQELAVIHVSLAATFADLKDHAQAVRHYRAELALRQGHPLEEGKTWLNIALAKEEARESYEEMQQCFQTALQCAEKAHNPKLQCRVLQHFHASQTRCGRPEAADVLARLRSLRQAQGWGSDGEVSEEEESQSPRPLEESDLELSESDREEALEDCGKSVSGRRRLPKWNQRNDRGETLLHRACIDGNLRRVQSLVEQGHPLNPRDYCGWTPLHEACNHGHLEIVRLLLDRGAAVDDPGGPGCEGITPLHDALNCGHFDVAELLVERGASVLRRNAKGLNPLGTLQAWVKLYGRDLDQETQRHCRAMEGLLRKAMAGRGARPPSPPAEQTSDLFDAELSESQASCPPSPPLPPLRALRYGGGEEQGLGKTCRDQREEPEEDCVAPLRPATKRQRLPREEAPPAPAAAAELSAPAQYRAAMLGLGSAQKRLPPSTAHLRLPEGPALVPPEEYVGDDWLDDDLGLIQGSRKRPRPNQGAPSGSESEETTEPESDDGILHQPPEAARKRQRRIRQSRLTQMVVRIPLGRPRETSRAGSPAGSAVQASTWLSEGTRGGESPSPGLTQPPAPPAPIRVRVQVQDNVFLIPVPHSSERRPVSWLADQASQRYYQTCGLLPRLTLKKEGALLAPQDNIVDVLQSNEEVLAEVQSWDLPPLLERYRKACQSLDVGEHQLLLKILAHQESGPSFSASGVALGRLQLTPLLRALKLQTLLQRLSLSGTGLGDDGAEELLACLGTLPRLKVLDLSATRLGPEGLCKLTAGLSGASPWQHLEELDLSLNPLGDSSCQSLALLVQACPLLSTLKLQACSLTAAFLQPPRLLLASALKGAVHLKQLVLSHNALGSAGLELLLKSLLCENLTHLEVGSVEASPLNQRPLQEVVASYLAQEGCALTHLTLSGNHLNDAAIAELARCLPTSLALVSLDLSANPEVSVVALRTLLLALEERNCGLQFLSLAGCAVRGPLDSSTWVKLSSHVGQLRLCSHHLSRSDQRDVARLWQGPPGTSFHSVTRHHKLFCQCL